MCGPCVYNKNKPPQLVTLSVGENACIGHMPKTAQYVIITQCTQCNPYITTNTRYQQYDVSSIAKTGWTRPPDLVTGGCEGFVLYFSKLFQLKMLCLYEWVCVSVWFRANELALERVSCCVPWIHFSELHRTYDAEPCICKSLISEPRQTPAPTHKPNVWRAVTTTHPLLLHTCSIVTTLCCPNSRAIEVSLLLLTVFTCCM